MKKTAWRITNNNEKDDAYREYGSTTYHCELDDAWLVTKLPKE
jgi:hypothetical protein